MPEPPRVPSIAEGFKQALGDPGDKSTLLVKRAKKSTKKWASVGQSYKMHRFFKHLQRISWGDHAVANIYIYISLI